MRWSFGTHEGHTAECVGGTSRCLPARADCRRGAALPAPPEAGRNSPQEIQRAGLAVLPAGGGCDVFRGGGGGEGPFLVAGCSVLSPPGGCVDGASRKSWKYRCCAAGGVPRGWP